jgi:hypothetical protein
LTQEDKKKIPKRNDLSYKPSLRFKPLIDFVNRKFLHYYNPRRELSVDESLVGTKGKTSMLQYIPSKRSRLGVKFWMESLLLEFSSCLQGIKISKCFDICSAKTYNETRV